MSAQLNDKKVLLQLVGLLVRPVVRFCLRHALRIQDLEEVCKRAFMELGEIEIKQRGEAVTMSRLSVMTGLHRRDVKRVITTDLDHTSVPGVSTRVVGRWQSDPDFMTKAKQPRILSFGSEGSEFSELVKKVSQDVNPATVLFELQRVGAVESADRGLKLSVLEYIPTGNTEEGFRIMSRDADDLYQSVEENLYSAGEVPNLHRRTEYDNVEPSKMPEIRRWFMEQGVEFHKRARQFLSQFDRDLNPSVSTEAKGCRVVLGSYSAVKAPTEE